MVVSLGGAAQGSADSPSLPPPHSAVRPVRWPKVLIRCGLAGIALAVLIGFLLPVALMLSVLSTVIGGGEERISGTSQPAEYTLEHGRTLVIYARYPGSAPHCNVRDGSGSDVMPTADLPFASTGPSDEPWEPVLAYPAVQGETYTIDCLGEEVRVGPPIPVGRLIVAGVAFFIGTLLGLTSLGLVLAGATGALLTRRR